MRFSLIVPPAIAASIGRALSAPLSAIQNMVAITEIKNVQSHYGAIIDAKTMDDRSQVFTSDGVAEFTSLGIGVLTGLPMIIEGMTISQAHDVTQHAMTTSYVEVFNETSANSTA